MTKEKNIGGAGKAGGADKAGGAGKAGKTSKRVNCINCFSRVHKREVRKTQETREIFRALKGDKSLENVRKYIKKGACKGCQRTIMFPYLSKAEENRIPDRDNKKSNGHPETNKNCQGCNNVDSSTKNYIFPNYGVEKSMEESFKEADTHNAYDDLAEKYHLLRCCEDCFKRHLNFKDPNSSCQEEPKTLLRTNAFCEQYTNN